ncbi:MAG: adenylyltransferase/cytidyltransferase family protein [Verrucomicrobia bacterium]|nr:adenylyltransferase/cytidyltransferase family protein [Verrucomicrobiota bacterium]
MKSKASKDYRRKIKTRPELQEIIGSRPRSRKVIMCHGTFDLVHPGHIRHLMYAKSKADILVASLTCDAHISKAYFRPFVPQELRAMNLAALEIVDYVLIDENPTPLENLELLQPDFFAKGYEYSKEGLHPKTREEVEVIEKYGGEIIFTPGDVIYSSSHIIENQPPNLAGDKLHSLMQGEGITFDQLRQALETMAGVRVHVLGDTIVDSHTYCTLIGGMAKTPTFSLKYENQVDFVGGAGVVAKHLRKAGADVKFTTVLGKDGLKDFVLKDLSDCGVECDAVIDPTRPTTQKNVFVTGGYRMLKVDKLDNRPISDKFLSRFMQSISSTKCDAIVFSDFRHGIFNSRTIPGLIASMPQGPLRIADSQVASRWGNILDFFDFDLITPNEREARFALGDQDSVIRPLARELYQRAHCKLLILKLGERGIITYRSQTPDDFRAFFTVDSFTDRLVDAVGAGDALLAYATLALAATKSGVIASILGSMAAAIACEREGNVPISPDEVLKKINAVEKMTCYS